MANFPPIHGIVGSGAWPPGYVVTQLDFQKIDEQSTKTANFADGSTHAPAATVNIGGSGFTFSGANHHLPGTLTVDSGGILALASGSVIAAIGGSVLRGTLALGDGTGGFTGTLAVGSLTVASGASIAMASGSSVSVASGSTVAVAAGAIVTIASSATLSGTVDFTGSVLIDGVSGMIVSTQISMGAASHLGFASGADITGTALLKGIISQSGAGHINARAPFVMTDADATKGINDCDIVMVNASVFTTDHNLTVTSTGATAGSRMRIFTNEATRQLTLKQDGGASFGILKSGTAGAAAIGFYKWVDIQHNGSADGWFVIGGLYVS